MDKVKVGDRVRVTYTSRLMDGSLVACAEESDPLEFTIGQNEVIPGFEQAVIGMNPGEVKRVVVPAENAYGEYRKELVVTLERKHLKMDQEPVVGHMFQVVPKDQPAFPVWVVGVTDEDITLDANHPLAGRDLNFEIKLLAILDSPVSDDEELER